MATYPREIGRQWQNPEHIDAWFADRPRQSDHQRLRAQLVKLLPFEAGAAIRVLDVGAGDGALSRDVLSVYPRAEVVCQDFSDVMLTRSGERLAPFSGQVTFVKSDFRDPGWTRPIPGMFDAVVSSVAIHNVTDHARTADPGRIRGIFAEVFRLVKPGGCFLDYDHMYAPGPVTEEVYRKVRAASQADVKAEDEMETRVRGMELKLHEAEGDNDGPSSNLAAATSRTVQTHLEWLKEAGFDEVDCFWKEMRFAILGGFRYSG
ncbi:MAG: class I SAM-dependent methyltransferase [Chloroflexi bacterium]|nr:class I SAM-dependent methyltransferase [Chloroflexota bacterium]